MGGNNELLDEVKQIYANNVNVIKTKYERKIDELKYNKLPRDKRIQIDNLKDQQKNDAVKRIKQGYKKYGEIVNKVEKGYSTFVQLVDLFDVSQFNSQVLDFRSI